MAMSSFCEWYCEWLSTRNVWNAAAPFSVSFVNFYFYFNILFLNIVILDQCDGFTCCSVDG